MQLRSQVGQSNSRFKRERSPVDMSLLTICTTSHFFFEWTNMIFWVTGASKSYGDLELHQRSSKSLLANVLDLDDNALASHNNLLNNVYSTPGPHHAHAVGHGHSHIHTTPHHHHSHAPTTPHHQHATPLPHSSYPGHQISHTPHHHPHPPDAPAPQVEILQNACFCARYELVLILKEIKVTIL